VAKKPQNDKQEQKQMRIIEILSGEQNPGQTGKQFLATLRVTGKG
jgi:hypothetical protein